MEGSWPADPYSTSYSSGGILAGDGDPGNISAHIPAYIKVHFNQVITTGLVGIHAASGHDTLIENNRVIGTGRIDQDGDIYPRSNYGIGVHNFHNQPETMFYNHTVRNNTVGWMRTLGGNYFRNDYWLDDATEDFENGSFGPADSEITIDDVNYERQYWMDKLSRNNISIGPNW